MRKIIDGQYSLARRLIEEHSDKMHAMAKALLEWETIDTERLAGLYNATFMRNDGRPGGLIAVKGRMLPQDAEELKSYFAGGGRVGEWRVIESDGLDARDMPTVRAIMRAAAGENYRFSALVRGIVRSVPFTMRVAQPDQVARN